MLEYTEVSVAGGRGSSDFCVFCNQRESALADGSPKELKPVSDEIAAKIEAAAPEKATAKPAKARKILVFWLCKGYLPREHTGREQGD